MKEETESALHLILETAAATGDPNVGEACRVVRRDLLNGGRSSYVPVVQQDVTNPSNASVSFKKKPKRR